MRSILYGVVLVCSLFLAAHSQNNTAIAQEEDEQETVFLAGIIDTVNYDWSPDIFEYTVYRINQGDWDHVASGYGPTGKFRLDYTLENSNCDETTAVRRYWDIRTENGNVPPDGVIGARCSGATIALAQLTGLEAVPQISPASNSARLSSVSEFPYFSRLVAPNDERGEVGALVALLRSFGWERVTILATDTDFSKDFANEFRKTWAGTNSPIDPFSGSVGYSDTIRLDINGGIDQDAVKQTLEGVPTEEPSVNSRIILLVAHSQHAFKILEAARRIQFQPDTVWVGVSSWVGRIDPASGLAFGPAEIPGYLGIAPFQNRNEVYDEFMSGFQGWQRSKRRATVLTDLPAFAAETVDSIVAMAAALAKTPVLPQTDRRRDGGAVVNQLRLLSFDGVSGFVEFTEDGDRKNPNYSILSATSFGSDGNIVWSDVGMVGPEAESAIVEYAQTCFALSGCGFDNIPDDIYPEEKVKLPVWIPVLLALLSLLFLLVAFKYWRSRMSKNRIKAELSAFQDSIVDLRSAGCDYIPNVTNSTVDDDNDDDASVHAEQALLSLSAMPPPVVRWCWKETESMMYKHAGASIYGDPNTCWILYNDEQTKLLESAFLTKKKTCSPLPGYVVGFDKMIQTKTATGFERNVSRIVESETVTAPATNQKRGLPKLNVGGVLPSDLKDEPQMVLVEGDMIQISKKRDDGWAFGTKLHHTDEEAARLFVKAATDLVGSSEQGDLNIFPDTGWFPFSSTRLPTAEELKVLQKKVDSGALDPPAHWTLPIKDKTVAQRHVLSEGGTERDSVLNSFMSSLRGKNVQVLKVERIQNLAMFQSYIVKRQTICYRETGDAADPATQQKALQRFERRWLWHGTNAEVVDKILNQGFNRSFCGKNATAYGKGVYFARDASYSSHKLYSVPDGNGNQYMMACSVCVGEYCRGRHDALTPDVRDARSHSLYDTTVGLIGGDSMANPSIYVTYHDAQAYPEYLITFRQP